MFDINILKSLYTTHIRYALAIPSNSYMIQRTQVEFNQYWFKHESDISKLFPEENITGISNIKRLELAKILNTITAA